MRQPRRQQQDEGRCIVLVPRRTSTTPNAVGAAYKLELMNDLLERRYDETVTGTWPDGERGASIHPLRAR